MKNILSISNIAERYHQKIFTGIFAYDADFDPIKIFEALDSQQIQRQIGIQNINQLPFCICVPRKFFIMIDLQDMFDKNGSAVLGEGYFSLLKAHGTHQSLPIQFFTNTYYNNMRFFLDGSQPDTGGIFNISPGVCNIFSKHFDLM